MRVQTKNHIVPSDDVLDRLKRLEENMQHLRARLMELVACLDILDEEVALLSLRSRFPDHKKPLNAPRIGEEK